jgi:tripartite-type tricarboxylate transporter receptor subunit TctC
MVQWTSDQLKWPTMHTLSKCLAKRTAKRLAKFVALAFASLAFVTADGTAQAADYPSRQIHLIVPYAAGGAADSIARILAKRISKAIGQTMVVENRPGGGSIVGTEFVNKSEPDGYTPSVGTIRTDFNQPCRL